jgi:hypothetical protein
MRRFEGKAMEDTKKMRQGNQIKGGTCFDVLSFIGSHTESGLVFHRNCMRQSREHWVASDETLWFRTCSWKCIVFTSVISEGCGDSVFYRSGAHGAGREANSLWFHYSSHVIRCAENINWCVVFTRHTECDHMMLISWLYSCQFVAYAVTFVVYSLP